MSSKLFFECCANFINWILIVVACCFVASSGLLYLYGVEPSASEVFATGLLLERAFACFVFFHYRTRVANEPEQVGG